MNAKSAPLNEATNWLVLGASAVLLLMGASRRSVFWTCVAISSVALLHHELEEWRKTDASGPDRVGYDDRTSRAIAAQNPSDVRSIELAR